MDNPYTELAGAIIRLKEEIIEGHDHHISLQRQVLELMQHVRALTDAIEAIHAVIVDVC